MKSMTCLVVLALVAAASAHPGGLTGIPLKGVVLEPQWDLAPKVQPIAPSVKTEPLKIRTVLAPVKTVVSAPLLKAPLISLQPQAISYGKLGGW